MPGEKRWAWLFDDEEEESPAPWWPRVPTRWIYEGDVTRATSLHGMGRKVLNDLASAVGFQELMVGSNSLELDDGSTIKVTINYGLSTVVIYSPLGEGEEEKERKCFCSPCFAQAVIVQVYINHDPDTHIVGPEDTETGAEPATQTELGLYYFTYDIAICTGKGYVVLENYLIKASGWEEYSVGQYVLVTIDKAYNPSDTPDCCINGICLSNDLANAAKTFASSLLVAPIFIPGLDRWQLV